MPVLLSSSRRSCGIPSSNCAHPVRDRTIKARLIFLNPFPYSNLALIKTNALCKTQSTGFSAERVELNSGDVCKDLAFRIVASHGSWKEQAGHPVLTVPTSAQKPSLEELPLQQTWDARMDCPNCPAIMFNAVTCVKLLRQCGNARSLQLGRRLHLHIIENRYSESILLDNLIVQMYGKCGALEDALAVFLEMQQKNVFSWTLIIGAYAQNGHWETALQLFEDMELADVVPDKVTFVTMISGCSDEAALADGKFIHSCIVFRGLECDVFVGNALVNMYGKGGNLEDSERLFDQMPIQNVVSWNTMIGAYAQYGQEEEALELFRQMRLKAVLPDKFTFVSLLRVCSSQCCLAEGKRFHSLVVSTTFESDIVVMTALLNMYSNWGSLEESRRIFDTMPRRDLVLWNSMIAAYGQHAYGKDVLKLIQQMHVEGVMLNNVSILTLLSVCGNLTALHEGKRMHASIVNTIFESDVDVGNALVTMYGKCGNTEVAQRVFDNMPERDVVSWNTMISAYVKHGQGQVSLQLFDQMQVEGVMPNNITFINLLDPCSGVADAIKGNLLHTVTSDNVFESDIILKNALANMYGKCGNLEDAQKIFYKIFEKDVVSWNAMISAYVHYGPGKGAFENFQQMQLECVTTNKVTFVSVLDACASEANLAEGKRIHVHAAGNSFESDITVGTSLINMYGKCGILDAAQKTFDEMPNRDVVSWNVMITIYSQHGHIKEALKLFQQMQQIGALPNTATFTSILSACSHAGLVAEGCHYFMSINCDHGLAPTVEQYNIMLDLLGRAGCLDEVEKLLHMIPSQPSATSWSTLLAACKNHLDINRGKRAAEQVLEIAPDNSAAHILLSSISVQVSALSFWKIREELILYNGVTDSNLQHRPF